MRWGILFNLALILAVSGFLLLMVFHASLHRSTADARMEEAIALCALLESGLATAQSREEVWEIMSSVCKARNDVGVTIYDSGANVLAGCGLMAQIDKPNTTETGRRLRATRQKWPEALVKGSTMAVDATGPFMQGVRAIRVMVEVPAVVFTPAYRFFAAYFFLTQTALFFLGYVLFHRTIIAPVRETARLAAKAAGIAESQGMPDYVSSRGDIQTIASSLRGMISRIVDDREKMANLVEQLRRTNDELVAAQQGLIRSEKLASVGRLAAGVAHEIGNPLQILMGYVEILNRSGQPYDHREILERVDQELRRIHEIVQRLLDFARPIKARRITFNLNELVGDAGSLVRGRKDFRHLELLYDLDPHLPPVTSDPDKLRQVMINLLFNAADSMPESGGTISLRTRVEAASAIVEVEDSGSGIPESDLDRVFDPFFTTKEPGKGTGLGLAVCLGLAESLGGSITVASQEGKGTKVTLAIPVPRERAQA